MLKYLFQGDSITDATRTRNENDGNNYQLGYGYPLLVASELLKQRKGEIDFINRGISGNRIVDVYARIKQDIINLKPDVMSILIGVNDVWHEFGSHNGVDAKKFEMVYSMLIEEIKEALPEIKMIILEPFVLKGVATESNYPTFRQEVEKRAAAAKAVAEKYDLAFVGLQAEFDKAAEDGDTAYWVTDGVHPTAAGHQLIKEELVKAINEMI
ncbi:MAG: lysophospholipase [Clostridia bacterium]|nr:lysophospholipase [Clostridia bacterium]